MDHRDHHRAPDKHQNLCDLHALVHPLDIAGAPVLPHIGGDGCAEGHEDGGYHALNLTRRGESGDIHGAEGIDCALHDDGADGRDGKLQAHGNSHAKQLAYRPQIRRKILSAEP